MNPGAKTHGMKADPLKYPWFKYECFLLSEWLERYTHPKLGGKLYERDRQKRTKEQKDENYIPFGINAGGIIITVKML